MKTEKRKITDSHGRELEYYAPADESYFRNKDREAAKVLNDKNEMLIRQFQDRDKVEREAETKMNSIKKDKYLGELQSLNDKLNSESKVIDAMSKNKRGDAAKDTIIAGLIAGAEGKVYNSGTRLANRAAKISEAITKHKKELSRPFMLDQERNGLQSVYEGLKKAKFRNNLARIGNAVVQAALLGLEGKYVYDMMRKQKQHDEEIQKRLLDQAHTRKLYEDTFGPNNIFAPNLQYIK